MKHEIVCDYESAVEFLNQRRVLGMRFQMHRIIYILNFLGNPQKQCRFIHVSGTNGKGSTVSFLMNLFRSNGMNVGTFTSPFLHTFLNHFHYNNVQMSKEDFVRIMKVIAPIIVEMDKSKKNAGVTEFEVATAIMFLYFSELKPDIVLVEVGMGGLLDATNVLTPEVSVITSIGIDHTGILGSTVEEIAFQKAGIIKTDKPIVLGDILDMPFAVIEKVANEKNSKIVKYEREYRYFDVRSEGISYVFSYSGFGLEITDIRLEMLGMHQVRNACLAISTYLIFCMENSIPIDGVKIKESIKKTYWHGRLEIVSESPLIILDGAHNVDGMKALLDVINNQFIDYHIHYLYAALTNKDTDTMIPMIDNVPNIGLIFTEFERDGADTADNLAKKSKRKINIQLNYWEVINKFIMSNSSDEILLIGGSLYFISVIRDRLLWLLEERDV